MLRATFRQLQTFVLVAETGSFAAAAARQGISPEAISEQIRGLEKKFGQKLFDRRPGTKPLLNDNGAALLKKVPALLENALDIARLSNEPHVNGIKKIRVGSGAYIMDRQLLPNLPRFQLQHPRIHVEFMSLSGKDEAIQKISKDQLDLAYLASRNRADVPIAECIAASSAQLVACPDHPATKDYNTKLPMLMPLLGSQSERYIVEALSEAGIFDFDVVTRAQHHETLIQLAIEGFGVACVLSEHVTSEIEDGRLVALNFPLPPLYRHVFRHPEALHEEHIREFDEFALRLLR